MADSSINEQFDSKLKGPHFKSHQPLLFSDPNTVDSTDAQFLVHPPLSYYDNIPNIDLSKWPLRYHGAQELNLETLPRRMAP